MIKPSRMVWKRKVFLTALTVIVLFASIFPATAESSPSVPLPTGFIVDVSGGPRFAPSYDAYTDTLPAWGYGATAGIEYALAHWIPVRAELGVFSVGASAWDDSLYRFRAFWGYRFAAMTGARFSVGKAELALLAGGALSASRFTGLNQVTAFASAVGELRFSLPVESPLFGGLAFQAIAAVPVEYQFRGTARTVSAGLDLGVGLTLPKGGAK